MKKITTVSEGVKKILAVNEQPDNKKWQIIETNDLVDFIEIDGKRYPFFWWREDPQMSSIKGGSVECLSVSGKFTAINERSQGLDKLMYKEFELADWVMDSTIERMTCFSKGNSANIVATYANKKVVMFELGSTLPDGTVQQGRHTVWGEQGMVSDRVVSQKLASSAIYMFTDSPHAKEYNDEVSNLYGLEKDDVNRVACVYKMLTGGTDFSDWAERDARVRRYIELAKKSAETGECVYVKEEA